MSDRLLSVPDFPRLTDYFGIWFVETNCDSFRALQGLIDSADMLKHFADSLAAMFDDDDHPGPSKPKQLTERVSNKGQSIAVIPVSGVLMKHRSSFGGTSTVQLRREIRQAANDPDVGAILLTIDSPGGTAAGTADLATEIHAARRKKPTWSQVEDVAASAAYWAASQTGQIFVNSPTTMVGSIGTYQTMYDLSQQAEREGIKVLHFATGPLKGAGMPGTPITAEQQQHFQAIVDGLQREFDRGVRLGRRMTDEELKSVRTGGVFLAREALDRRLIDGVQSMDKTLDLLADAAGQRTRTPRAAALITA